MLEPAVRSGPEKFLRSQNDNNAYKVIRNAWSNSENKETCNG